MVSSMTYVSCDGPLTLPIDVKAMRESIEPNLLLSGEKRGRRNAEISLMENRAGVETLYNRLRTAESMLTSLHSRPSPDLPVIAMIQTTERTNATKSVADVLQNNPLMADLLKTQLTKWTEKAKQDLGVVLGFPRNWKSANKNILHPVERLTGRFLCTRCERVDVKYRNDGCLDFAGACRHECGGWEREEGKDKEGEEWKWDPSMFARDTRLVYFRRVVLNLRN